MGRTGSLEISTLGGLSIRLADEPLTALKTRKVEALLVYLACTGRTHPREALAEMFWEERTQAQAMTNLRSALSSLRKQLEPYVIITRDTAAMNPGAVVWLDVAELEENLSPVRDAETAAQVERALDLYKGAFLEGFYLRGARGFDEWEALERERLGQRALQALSDLVAYDLASGAFRTGIAHANRLLALDPLMESAHRQLMLLLAASGQRGAALAQYESCQSLLQEELGVEPSTETREVYELLLQGQRPPGIPPAADLVEREPSVVGACPYRGLAAFREQDAPFFFGREGFTDVLFQALHERPMVAVIVGSSGSGKSSAVFAGLMPRLREAGPGPAQAGEWLLASFRPGDQPFQSLAAALLPLYAPGLDETDRLIEAGKMARALSEGDVPLAFAVEQTLERHPRAERLLLVVDQFEELYTLCPEPELRQRFLDELLAVVGAAAARRDAPVVLLLTLRADFMGQALAYRPFADALQEASLMMGPMNRQELRAAIEKPAEKQGAAFEAGLVERLLDDVGLEPGSLPLLEFALTLLWERQAYGWMTHAGYEAIGRVEGALARYADRVFGALDAAEQGGARRVFVQLVRPGEGTEDTRRVATRAELGDADANWALVQHLADERLVVTGRDAAGDETVEVVHEALIQRWGQLRGWMAQDRAFRTWQERLRVALRGWEASAGDQGALLRGAPLAEAEGWLAERGAELSQAEEGFIEASVALRERRQFERERRRRRTILALAGGLVVALVLALLTSQQWQRAEGEVDNRATAEAVAVQERQAAQAEADNRATAEAIAVQERQAAQAETDNRATAEAAAVQERKTAELQARLATVRELVAASANNLAVDPERSILLALQAVNITYAVDQTVLPQAEAALHRAVSASHILFTLHPEEFESDWVVGAFSPDGTRLATGYGRPGTAVIWDAVTGQRLLTLQHTPGSINSGYIEGIAFSPDGARLATTDYMGGTTKIWDAATGQKLQTFYTTGRCGAVDFSPDGTRLVTGCEDGMARMWDSDSGKLLLMLTGHIGWARDVAFSPDGTRLATSDDETVQVWDISAALSGAGPGAKKLLTLSGHTASVWDVAFSPECVHPTNGGAEQCGTRLATASDDGTAKVWDAHTGRELLSLTGHADRVSDVAFSLDGTRLATASTDGTAKVWDLSTGKESLSLAGHTAMVLTVGFSPDGTRLATTSRDGTAKIWDITPDRELLSFASGTAYDMALSPDGTRLATSSDRGTATVWDLATGEQLLTVSDQGHTQPLDVVKFSTDGNRVTPGVAFSPDGMRLVIAGSDHTPKVWDLVTGQRLFTLRGHLDHVSGVAFSPDGTLLATAGRESATGIWDAATGELLFPCIGHGDRVRHVVFSPDSTLLASVSSDYTAIIWDTATGKLRRRLSGHTAALLYAAFSPDGARLATAGWDAVKIWDPRSGEELLTLSGHTNAINGIAYSSDGARLATASTDGTTRIWDAATGEELLAISTYPVGVARVAFSQDGTRLITANFDNTVRVYVLPIEELITLAQSRVTRSLTEEECQQYLHVEECPTAP